MRDSKDGIRILKLIQRDKQKSFKPNDMFKAYCDKNKSYLNPGM